MFSADAQSWRDFYMVTAGVAATLVGLLFVGLSLHVRTVATRPEVRALARATLTNFALVLLSALYLLIPQSRQSVGDALIFTGVFSIVVMLRPLGSAVRSTTRTLRVAQLAMRFGTSLLCYAGGVAAGALFTNDNDGAAFTCLAVVTIALLVISLRNSWDLLVSVAEAMHRENLPDP